MSDIIKIGTRESELAQWQAKKVQALLLAQGIASELVLIKSEGDIDLSTPLYEIGVQGIFTKSLDIALLQKRIDIAVHSYKDVPTQMAKGITIAAVLERDSYQDILVFKEDKKDLIEQLNNTSSIIATSSIRRKAQWLHKYPHHQIENLRGNVNTRLKKLEESNWSGAIFAAAGLERIQVRPEKSIDLDWMLPAPAQGTVVVVCRAEDENIKNDCAAFNHNNTAICTGIERDFLRTLMGGCSTPVSALAEVKDDVLHFKGSIVSVDGKEKVEIEKKADVQNSKHVGKLSAEEILTKGGNKIIELIRDGNK
ncbi:MAG: hydroxymethylbilane synthase [Agriterribacter sp.]